MIRDPLREDEKLAPRRISQFHRLLKQARFLLPLNIRALQIWGSRKVPMTMVPLFVIWIIPASLGKGESWEIFRRPEVAFSAIVLFDAAIGKLTFLVRRPLPLPIRLKFFARFLILPLILSVVFFSLATLQPYLEGTEIELTGSLLFWGPALLFILALGASFAVEVFDLAGLEEGDQLPSWISKYRYFVHLKQSLRMARDSLRYACFALDREKDLELFDHGGIAGTDLWTAEQRKEVRDLLETAQQHARRVEALLESPRTDG